MSKCDVAVRAVGRCDTAMRARAGSILPVRTHGFSGHRNAEMTRSVSPEGERLSRLYAGVAVDRWTGAGSYKCGEGCLGCADAGRCRCLRRTGYSGSPSGENELP